MQSLPENLTPGERTIKVGSVQGPVDGRGVATDAAFLAELAANEELIAGLTQDPGSTPERLLCTRTVTNTVTNTVTREWRVCDVGVIVATEAFCACAFT